MPADETILYEVTDGVAIISFSRPARRNAWTRGLEHEYFAALMRASEDADVRALVITGDPAGRAFCPGADTDVLQGATSGGKPLSRNRWPHTMLTRVPKPTIAAINGACAGLGLIQALYADVRFAQAGAKLTTAFARRGLPAENGIAWVLGRLAGHAPAADLLLSGRVFTAEEAYELGLVKAVLPAEELMAAALDYARDIATNCSPAAMAQIKEQLYLGLEQDMESARQLAVHNLYERRLDDDFAEGVASYMEKRSPTFAGVSVDLTQSLVMDPG